MKIINVVTNNIFDLPKKDAEHLLASSPDIFEKVSKNKKVVNKDVGKKTENSVLRKILDE